jgi:hypothetical protein
MNYLVFGGLSSYKIYNGFRLDDQLYQNINSYIVHKYGFDLYEISKSPTELTIHLTDKIKNTYFNVYYKDEQIYTEYIKDDILTIKYDKGVLNFLPFKGIYTLCFQYMEYQYNKNKYKDYIRLGYSFGYLTSILSLTDNYELFLEVLDFYFIYYSIIDKYTVMSKKEYIACLIFGKNKNITKKKLEIILEYLNSNNLVIGLGVMNTSNIYSICGETKAICNLYNIFSNFENIKDIKNYLKSYMILENNNFISTKEFIIINDIVHPFHSNFLNKDIVNYLERTVINIFLKYSINIELVTSKLLCSIAGQHFNCSREYILELYNLTGSDSIYELYKDYEFLSESHICSTLLANIVIYLGLSKINYYDVVKNVKSYNDIVTISEYDRYLKRFIDETIKDLKL